MKLCWSGHKGNGLYAAPLKRGQVELTLEVCQHKPYEWSIWVRGTVAGLFCWFEDADQQWPFFEARRQAQAKAQQILDTIRPELLEGSRA